MPSTCVGSHSEHAGKAGDNFQYHVSLQCQKDPWRDLYSLDLHGARWPTQRKPQLRQLQLWLLMAMVFRVRRLGGKTSQRETPESEPLVGVVPHWVTFLHNKIVWPVCNRFLRNSSVGPSCFPARHFRVPLDNVHSCSLSKRADVCFICFSTGISQPWYLRNDQRLLGHHR